MESHAKSGHGKGNYGRLMAMVILSFLSIYGLMYAMVDRWSNVFANVNQFYMAGLMAAPMLLIELILMANMYPNRSWNLMLAAAAVVFMGLCWFGIRQQWGVGDEQFARSMIPHHAGAILMCEQNRVQDPQLQRLCAEIIASQRREIEQMKAVLKQP